VVEITVTAPCCNSRRTCRDTYVEVFEVVDGGLRSIKTFGAVRCYRGKKRVYTIKYDETKTKLIVATLSWSVRGNLRIYIEHSDIEREKAEELIRRHYGLIQEKVITLETG
jgi:hypothetical protein